MAGMEEHREYVLRALRASDAEAAAALIRLAVAAQTVATDPPPSALRETGASVAASLAEQDQGGIGAWIGDSLAGYPGPLAGVLAGMDFFAAQGTGWVVTVAADELAKAEGAVTCCSLLVRA